MSACPPFLGVLGPSRYVGQCRRDRGALSQTDLREHNDKGLFTAPEPETLASIRMIDAGGGVLLGKLLSDALT